MSTAKHMKGPWGLCFHLQSEQNDKKCSCGYRGSVWTSDGNHIICEMGESLDPQTGELWHEPLPRDEQIKLAHLIAAAPDLLEALKSAVEWIEEECEIVIGSAEEHCLNDYCAAIAKAEGGAK